MYVRLIGTSSNIFYLALLVFIVLCSSDGVFGFPAAGFSSLLTLNPEPFVPVLTLLLLAPFPLNDVAVATDGVVILLGEELVEISVAVDFLVGLPGPDLPLVAKLVVSSVAFLVLV